MEGISVAFLAQKNPPESFCKNHRMFTIKVICGSRVINWRSNFQPHESAMFDVVEISKQNQEL